MAKEYDLVIVGGGTGGYVAAIRASQLGMKTAIVEKKKLGGTCLHSGCIPTKTLLKSAEVYRTMKESHLYGVYSHDGTPTINLNKIQERKNNVIEQLHKGVQMLIKKGKIDVYYGIGRILGPSIFSPLPGTISVELEDGGENEMLIPKYVLLATGSKPREIPQFPYDGERILSSDDMLNVKELPKSIIIVGGGVIGVEFASMLADFDVKVTLIEAADRILPLEDYDISIELTKHLKKKGIQLFTSTKVLSKPSINENEVVLRAKQDEQELSIVAEKILVSVGREATTQGIGLENTDIVVHNGYIQVNEYYQTKESHIYAIGDCIGGMQLAHVATKEGVIAVEHLNDKNPQTLNYSHVPKCVYSFPEIASIGLTEEEAKTNYTELKIGKFPFKGIGKALVNGHSDGFIKMIADAKTNDLLGIHMIGANVTELISEASLATTLDATPDEIADTIHPHPTLSEIFAEVSLLVEGKPIHF